MTSLTPENWNVLKSYCSPSESMAMLAQDEGLLEEEPELVEREA